VAHRALVAYERPDGRYDVHSSRWGGLDCRLAETISAVDPYAGETVDPAPRVVARPFADVLTMIDPARHEALYRVSSEYVVDTYLPLWYELGHYLGGSVFDHESARQRPEGIVVAVDSPADADAFREWFQAAKDTVAEAVLGGYLSRADARAVLADAVRQRGAGRELFDPWSNERTNDY
jgi:hypothetical protein